MKVEIKNDRIVCMDDNGKLLRLYTIMFRFKIWFIDLRAIIYAKIWWQKQKWGTVIWFAKRTIQAMRGKIGIVDSREVYSKGGFKYYQCEISQMPLNKDADYSKF